MLTKTRNDLYSTEQTLVVLKKHKLTDKRSGGEGEEEKE